ncbi:MAG: hypothetical protein KGI89_03090 [Euryarchaeota archaeon]|nr:hypothetical protein [Euryarchaeota archaeon]
MGVTYEQRKVTNSIILYTVAFSPPMVVLLALFVNWSWTLNGWGTATVLVICIDALAFSAASINAVLIESTPHGSLPIGLIPMSDLAPITLRTTIFPEDGRTVAKVAAKHMPELRPVFAREQTGSTALASSADTPPVARTVEFIAYPVYGVRGLGFITQPGREGIIVAPGKFAVVHVGDAERGASYIWSPCIPQPLPRAETPGEWIDQLKQFTKFDEDKTPIFLLTDVAPRYQDWMVDVKPLIEDIWATSEHQAAKNGWITQEDYRQLWRNSNKYASSLEAENAKLSDRLQRELNRGRLNSARSERVAAGNNDWEEPMLDMAKRRRQKFEDEAP